MTTHRQHHLPRLAIAGAFLLAALTGTAQVAIAGPPHVDPGGPSGGTVEIADRPIYLEHFGLVATNDPSEPITGHTRLDGPSLVGSGPEREIVANTGDQELDGPSLVGSGPEREIVANADDQQSAGVLDETARSNDLIALSPQASSPVAESMLDEAARSNDLIALSPQASSTIAVAPTEARFGQPF